MLTQRYRPFDSQNIVICISLWKIYWHSFIENLHRLSLQNFGTLSYNNFDTAMSCILWKLFGRFVDVLFFKKTFFIYSNFIRGTIRLAVWLFVWKTSTVQIQERCLLGSDDMYLEEFYKSFSEKVRKILSEERNFFSEDGDSAYFYQTTRRLNQKTALKLVTDLRISSFTQYKNKNYQKLHWLNGIQ